MTDVLTVKKRLHVGGLTPNITTAHLRDRFKIFGQVEEVEELQPDGLGQPRPFAYLTIDITPLQLKRCMNILSGSMYRGAQLRIAEARPRYVEKLQRENNPTPAEQEAKRVKKRKRARREAGPEVGQEAQDMRPVTEEDYQRSQFWSLTPENHLIRPLALRPTHTLPPPMQSLASTSKAKDVKRNPPSRQRRKVINPLQWGPSHLSEDILLANQSDEPEEPESERGEWIFEEDLEADSVGGIGDDADETDGMAVLGRWRQVGGKDDGAERIVRVRRHRAHIAEDSDGGASEVSQEWNFSSINREASPLFGDREQGVANAYEPTSKAASDRSASPLFASRAPRDPMRTSVTPASGSKSDGQSSDLENDQDEFVRSGIQLSDSVTNRDETAEADELASADASSPLFAVRQVSPVGAIPLETPAALASSHPELPEALVSQVKDESALGLTVISSLLAETPDAQYIPVKPVKNEWRGFDESDSDEDDTLFGGRNVASEGVLRIRGGAPNGTPEGMQVDGDGDLEDNEEEESDSDSDTGSQASSSSSSTSSASSSSTSSASTSSVSSSSSSSSSGSSSSGSSASGEAGPSKSTIPDTIAKSLPTFGFSAPSGTGAGPGAGFSLADLAGDFEMDDELDIPLAPHLSGSASAQKPELELLTQMSNAQKQLFDPDPEIPLFFAPADPTRTEQSRPGWARHILTIEKEAAQSSMESGEVVVDGTGRYAGFLRQDTDQGMRERWDRVRGDLTAEWKRRGREARKQRKRRGGPAGDD